eukprot:UN11387
MMDMSVDPDVSSETKTSHTSVTTNSPSNTTPGNRAMFDFDLETVEESYTAEGHNNNNQNKYAKHIKNNNHVSINTKLMSKTTGKVSFCPTKFCGF